MKKAVTLLLDLLIQPAERKSPDEWARSAIRAIFFSSELSMTWSQEAQVTLESGPLTQYVEGVPIKILVKIYLFNSQINYQNDTSGLHISLPEVWATFLITSRNWGKREEFKKSKF